ncbi:hypothetical protein TcCL_NonESM10764, partial [Trypanosoma cruzi]
EDSPVASSQSAVSSSRGSALHNRQRHHTRRRHYTQKEGMKKHGGGPQSRETLTQINCKVRLDRSRLDGGRVAAVRCVCPQNTAMMKKGERDAVRSSSISVGRGKNNTIPPDCLRQRLSHSAEVGAFLPKLERHSTKAVARRLPHRHNEGTTADDATRATSTQPP